MSKKGFGSIAGEGVVGPIGRLFDGLKLSDTARKQFFESAVGDLRVIGVRDAKDAFSRILNEASDGKVTCVEAGNGGVVILMNASILADAVAVLEEKRELTLGEALKGLPFKAEQLVPVKLRGRAPGETALRRRPPAASLKTT